MSIGSRIKERREALGMSQEELAEKVGYKSRSSINKIELNVRDLTQQKIIDFANALRVTPEYIMGWSEGESALMELAKETTVQKKLLNFFEQLDETDQEDIIKYIKFKLSDDKYKKESVSV